jgi:CHAT domain-containing protein
VFMKSFYHHLKSAPSKAVALQHTMRELREVYPHPYYWAPFALIGNFTND